MLYFGCLDKNNILAERLTNFFERGDFMHHIFLLSPWLALKQWNINQFQLHSNPLYKFVMHYILGWAMETCTILNLQEKGFFIEAGAYDGEVFSNSLFYELKHGWTGLLVEPNPDALSDLVKSICPLLHWDKIHNLHILCVFFWKWVYFSLDRGHFETI